MLSSYKLKISTFPLWGWKRKRGKYPQLEGLTGKERKKAYRALPEIRARSAKQQRDMYHNNPAHRERVLGKCRAYQQRKEVREAVSIRKQNKYWSDPEHREKIKQANKRYVKTASGIESTRKAREKYRRKMRGNSPPKVKLPLDIISLKRREYHAWYYRNVSLPKRRKSGILSFFQNWRKKV